MTEISFLDENPFIQNAFLCLKWNGKQHSVSMHVVKQRLSFKDKQECQMSFFRMFPSKNDKNPSQKSILCKPVFRKWNSRRHQDTIFA